MNQRIKHGPFWTGLFSVISLAWLFPLALVLINSFKKKVYISADTFSLPTGKEFAGLFNYKDGIEKTNFIASFGWSLVITVGAVASHPPLHLDVRLVDCASEQRRIENHLRVVPVEHDCSIPDGDVPSVEDG